MIGADCLRVTHPYASAVHIAINDPRLACVRHAASVRPEPGSNSPLYIKLLFANLIQHRFDAVCGDSSPRRAIKRACVVCFPLLGVTAVLNFSCLRLLLTQTSSAQLSLRGFRPFSLLSMYDRHSLVAALSPAQQPFSRPPAAKGLQKYDDFAQRPNTKSKM